MGGVGSRKKYSSIFLFHENFTLTVLIAKNTRVKLGRGRAPHPTEHNRVKNFVYHVIYVRKAYIPLGPLLHVEKFVVVGGWSRPILVLSLVTKLNKKKLPNNCKIKMLQIFASFWTFSLSGMIGLISCLLHLFSLEYPQGIL